LNSDNCDRGKIFMLLFRDRDKKKAECFVENQLQNGIEEKKVVEKQSPKPEQRSLFDCLK